MQPLDAGGGGIRQRLLDAVLHVSKAIRQCRKAALAFAPVARKQIEQRLRQAIAVKPFADFVRRMLIGKEEFNR